jgi:hypothetical protein
MYGLYFIFLYILIVLQIEPPAGWSFEPKEVILNVDGTTDYCSQGKDINFVFKGFAITGKVSTVFSSLHSNCIYFYNQSFVQCNGTNVDQSSEKSVCWA